MSDFTNDELALIVAAIDSSCCAYLNQATRHPTDITYVLAGAGSKQFSQSIELRAKVLAELEQRKGATCNEASS